MAARERSLRHVVESWLGTQEAGHIRVTRFSHTRRKLWRYVCVEASRERGKLSIVFFRHDDGSWCVFPPAPRSPVMGAAMETHASLRRPFALACEP
ncbi:hypothetical protein LMG27952_07453 [Paraburkholderia hiiakae]|uniref:Uncharacterized protein n=1 Tax=Paraburkholderia hiiakae TaxID=1081782 RepID=A0ABN7IIQ3_9BURK|nr:hypothetical protein [Paraburkholderia hiiakae]CAD6561393.1 hypothetical protein LMG27952_07453 [Paraburkholderia hiiakae]